MIINAMTAAQETFMPMTVLFLGFGLIALGAWIAATGMFIELAKQKGYYEQGGSGALWFIGIFATPIVVGLYVIALPDKSSGMEKSVKNTSSALADELPDL